MLSVCWPLCVAPEMGRGGEFPWTNCVERSTSLDIDQSITANQFRYARPHVVRWSQTVDVYTAGL